MGNDHWPPLKFDAVAAGQLLAFVDAWRGQLQLDGLDVDWGRRIISAYANLAPIASARQERAYQQRSRQILDAKLGRLAIERDEFAAFVRTDDGVLALALMARISQWEHHREDQMRHRAENLITAALCLPKRIAGQAWRTLKGGN